MIEKRRRRWFQFSLRTLFVFVLVVSIMMSWLGSKIARPWRQKEAIDVVRSAGGLVKFSASSSVPAWLENLGGGDFFSDVDSVFVNATDFGDDEAACLESLTSLDTLSLYGTQVTDAGLEHLKELPELGWLSVEHTQVTAQGIQSFRQALPDCEICIEEP